MSIEIINVRKLYPASQRGQAGEIRALDGVSLSVRKGEWLAIMGPSVPGKPFQENRLGCLDRPLSEDIFTDGRDLGKFYGADLNASPASKSDFVSQQFHLIPNLTA